MILVLAKKFGKKYFLSMSKNQACNTSAYQDFSFHFSPNRNHADNYYYATILYAVKTHLATTSI